MGIAGTGLTDKNVRLRFLMICFCGVVAFGAILYWREQAIFSQDYVDFDRPAANKRKAKEAGTKFNQQNLNNELETQN